jgi:UDP-glucuronate decarboxylase
MMDAPDFIGPVNLGNPDEFTMLELAALAIELSRSSSKLTFMPLPPDDPTRRRPDITVARERLGWGAQNPLARGTGGPHLEHFRHELGLVRA